MEGLIIYIIIAVVAIFNFIKNYKKEQAKQKKRAEDILSQPIPIPTNRPFQKKKVIIPTTLNDVSERQPEISLEEEYSDIKHEPRSFEIKNNHPINEYTNLYNSKDIEAILAKIEDASNSDEREAFFIETETASDSSARSINNNSIELGLNSPEDYRRAFIHSLIFNRKY